MKHNNNIIYKFALLILLFSACKHKSIIDQNIEAYIQKNAHNPDSYEPISTKLDDSLTYLNLYTNQLAAIQSFDSLERLRLAYDHIIWSMDGIDHSIEKLEMESIKKIEDISEDVALKKWSITDLHSLSIVNDSTQAKAAQEMLNEPKKYALSSNLQDIKEFHDSDIVRLKRYQTALDNNIKFRKELNNKIDSIKESKNPNSIYSYHFIHQCRARVPLGGMMLKNIYIETDKDLNIQKFEEM